MYESFFGLSQRPFPAAPVARRYFPGTSIDAARAQLLRCLQRGEGPALVVGGPGLGKTLLLLVVAEQLQEQFPVALLTSGLIRSRKELLQTLLEAVGEEELLGEEADLRLRLTRRLSRDERFQRGVLLLVDEAHTLQPPLLDELRMLTNLAREGEPVVRLVLAGTMRLEEHLSLPELESLNQRLALRCYLECFDKAETADYVRFELAVSGGQAEHVFEPEAYEAIYRATEGVPRLINQVCDHALLLAQARGVKPVPATLIQEAWAQLQQLPTPWTELPSACSDREPDSAVIEFGSLEEEEDESLPAEAEAPEPQQPVQEEAPAASEAQQPEDFAPRPGEAEEATSDQQVPAEEPAQQEAPAAQDAPEAEPIPSPPPSAQEEHSPEEPSEPEPQAGPSSSPEQQPETPPAFARGSLDIQMTLEQIDQTWQQLLADSSEASAEASSQEEPPARQEDSPARQPLPESAPEEPTLEEETAPQAETPPEQTSQQEQATPPAEAATEEAPDAEEPPRAQEQDAADPVPVESSGQFEEEVIEDLYAALDARERQETGPFSAAASAQQEVPAPRQQSPEAEAAVAQVSPEPNPRCEEQPGPPGSQELQVHLSQERVQVVVDPYAALAGDASDPPENTAEQLPSAAPEPDPASPETPEAKLPLSQALRRPAPGEESSGQENQPASETSPGDESSPTLEVARESLPELEIHGSGIVLIDEEEEEEEGSEALDVWPIPRDQLAEAFDQLQGRTEAESS